MSDNPYLPVRIEDDDELKLDEFGLDDDEVGAGSSSSKAAGGDIEMASSSSIKVVRKNVVGDGDGNEKKDESDEMKTLRV